MNARARTTVLASLALLAAAQLAAPPLAAKSIGVVIGNRDYPQDVGVVEYAHNDASAIYEALRHNWQGWGEIIILKDLTLAGFHEWFGPREGVPGKLARLARAADDVVVFYSGHGAPGLNDRAGYLLPVDANPDMAQYSGYPLDTLKANLEALEARSVVLLIDACFSGLGHAENVVKAISGPMSIISKPLASESRLSVLTAASGAQVASWDEKAEHGLFTRYLLDALAGAADGPPFGDGDGRLLLSETKAWLDREMTDAASRLDRDQIANLSGNAAGVLPMRERRVLLPCPNNPETECLLLDEWPLKSQMGNRDLIYREFSQDVYADMTMSTSDPELSEDVIVAIHYADRPDNPPLWSDIVYAGGSYVSALYLEQSRRAGMSFEFLSVGVTWHGTAGIEDQHMWVGGKESWRPLKTDLSGVDEYVTKKWSKYDAECAVSKDFIDFGNLKGSMEITHVCQCNACGPSASVDFDLKLKSRDGEAVLVLDGPPTELTVH